MPKYNIRGIDVDFPFEAYDCQLVYIEKVIQALQTKRNALLESPTGTGKTLCLLCATLAWRKSLGEFSVGRKERINTRGSQNTDEELSQSLRSEYPKIIYTSRTHSQIKQVIQELRRSKYRPRMVVLGSREQLCIHDQVSLLRGKAQTSACQVLCKKRSKRYCAHFSRVAEFVKSNPSIGDDPIDIEDLLNLGRNSGPCPYYLSRELHKDADIIFSPYNYLIDRENRRTLKDIWRDSIIIFDEAHNLESLCADAASFDLPSSLLNSCITEAKKCVDLSVARRQGSGEESCNPDNFAILGALFSKLEKRISEVIIESKELGLTKPGPYIYELLSELNVTQETVKMLIDIIEEGCKLLEEDTKMSEMGGSHKTAGAVFRLGSIADILKLIFRDKNNAHAQYYRVHIQEVEANSTDMFRGKTSRTLSWWCFNPGITMEEFCELGVGSVILTSGTLSPMDSFAEELKLPFPIRLENPHVISENQIWAGVAAVGPSGYPFNSSYRSRDSIEYKMELGNAIVNFARIVPDGLLVFFPSYYLLEQCINFWKSVSLTNPTSIWERICKHKFPVVEPRQASLFPAAIDAFMKNLKDASSGSIFFAVCRGKVSEGLDFADNAGRAVVVTGLPFATLTDPKVRLKREFMDNQAESKKTPHQPLTGEEWYSQQASRAVNQAVGRVIRHRHDYGAIIFCDERFMHSKRQSQVSSWIRPYINCYPKFGDVVFTLTRFFRESGMDGLAKSEPMKRKVQENLRASQSFQLSENLSIEKPRISPIGAIDLGHSSPSQSSGKKVQKMIISSDLSEVVPANRSSLKSEKVFQDSFWKGSTDIKPKIETFSEKKTVELSEQPSSIIAPCSLKKLKLLINGPGQSTNRSNSDHCLETSTSNGILRTTENPAEASGIHNNKFLVDKRVLLNNVVEQKNAIPHGLTGSKEEMKGSAFLAQVREKLSEVEYRQFVEYMRALKSKEMRIGQVLESITRLFSTPQRQHLRHGFRDFVPVKYRAIYDRFLSIDGFIYPL